MNQSSTTSTVVTKDAPENFGIEPTYRADFNEVRAHQVGLLLGIPYNEMGPVINRIRTGAIGSRAAAEASQS